DFYLAVVASEVLDVSIGMLPGKISCTVNPYGLLIRTCPCDEFLSSNRGQVQVSFGKALPSYAQFTDGSRGHLIQLLIQYQYPGIVNRFSNAGKIWPLTGITYQLQFRHHMCLRWSVLVIQPGLR